MSRAGYSDDCADDPWSWIMWRGQVASSIRGKRGQAFLRELIAALEAMPKKRLIADALQESGEVCAIGAVGVRRGVNLEALDPDQYEAIAESFNIAEPLVREIEFENDERDRDLTPEERWAKMHAWAKSHLKESP
jgi:hypothetical protein